MASKHKPESSGEKSAAPEAYYCSDRLKYKLEQLRQSRAALVEAPPGYGKTTAVREYLSAIVPPHADILWFTAEEEAPAASFQRLCREIEKIDNQAGGNLLKIGLPDSRSIGEICHSLRSLECRRQTWLALDNFHLLCAHLPTAFLLALFGHNAASLHIVLITRPLGRAVHTAIAGCDFLHITPSDLRLELEDISRYDALGGIRLSPPEARQIMGHTDGWPIAVCSQLRAFRESGLFSEQVVLSLLEKLVWDKLSGEQQAFFLRLSPFESLTPRQMCALLGADVLPDYALEVLASPFMHHYAGRTRYEPHGLLLELVRQKRAERGAAFERDCLLRAGDLCRDEGRVAEALGLYSSVKAYDQMLSLDLGQVIFADIDGAPFGQIALDIAKHCPIQTRRAHLLSMLHIAWALKVAGQEGAFGELLAELDSLVGQDRPLRAEWLLLSAYRHFPHLDKMLPLVRQAAALLDGACSQVILPDAPWAFGGYYQLTEFHLRAGQADQEAEVFEEFITLYARLTNGHGSGADALFRAELAHLRGEMVAEIFAYKALFLAESKQQAIIQLGAAMTLANIALMRSDAAAWQHAIDSMERAAGQTNQNASLLRAVLDTVRGSLLVELNMPARIADWLKNRDLPNNLLAPMALNALYVHGLFLMGQGEFTRFLGALTALPPEDGAKSAYARFSLALLLAAGHALTGQRDKAAEFFARAAAIGLPDGLLIHFVSYARLFPELIETLITEKYPWLIDQFSAIKAQFALGWKTLRQAMVKGELPDNLTAREQEIALLVIQGLCNREIAERLFISESTVRTHMRVIFQKLDIDRRAKLAEKLT